MTRRLQCKDIDSLELLRFIDRKSAEDLAENPRGSGWVKMWDLEPPYSELPDNLFRAKTGRLIKHGLLDGCNCGCRGDYVLTDKGKAAIEDNEEPTKGTAMPSNPAFITDTNGATEPSRKPLEIPITLTGDVYGTPTVLGTAYVSPRIRTIPDGFAVDLVADVADALTEMAAELKATARVGGAPSRQAGKHVTVSTEGYFNLVEERDALADKVRDLEAILAGELTTLTEPGELAPYRGTVTGTDPGNACVNLVPDGENPEHYTDGAWRYLDHYSPAVGDRVLVGTILGEAIVLGKVTA